MPTLTLNMPGALVYHEREARGLSAGKYMHHNESQFGGGSGLKPDADDLMYSPGSEVW